MSENEAREKAWLAYSGERADAHASYAGDFNAGYDAAKSEPVTIDRDALVAIFKTGWHLADNHGETGHRTEAGIDAVIAHLAAQPVTGTVEWGIRFPSGYVSQHPNEESARRDQQHPYALGVGPPVALVSRTVPEWVEVPNGD